MTISTLPAPPEPTDTTAAFNSKAFALLAALPQFVTQTNADGVIINATTATTTTNAATATTKAAEALVSANAAALSASNLSSGVITTNSNVVITNADVVTVTQLKADAISALNSAALTEDWGLVTEAVTASLDYGVM